MISTNFLFLKVCWQRPAMLCLYTLSKLSHPKIWIFTEGEGDGMEWNSNYLLKSFLLYMFSQKTTKVVKTYPKIVDPLVRNLILNPIKRSIVSWTVFLLHEIRQVGHSWKKKIILGQIGNNSINGNSTINKIWIPMIFD